ncbi:MAG: hypothetical protein IJK29_11825 [Bacteroidales bacterium]|nr:hypothetical protein [Bacteroidales bacterium]MBQ6177880.1 hypothetical protein [Bacteroidales bacterium]
MKHMLLMLLCLILAVAPAAAASADLLPTPKPADNAQPAAVTLPNFGSLLGDEGELTAEDYAYNGRTWTVWYFPQSANWGNAVDSFLAACKKAGFTHSFDSFDGNIGYVLDKDGLRAILIPGLNGQIMLMAEKGLTVAEYEKKDAKALEIGDVRVTYNGREYAYSAGSSQKLFLNTYGSYYEFYSIVSGELHWLQLRIPSRVETGTHKRFTRTQRDQDGWYFLNILAGDHKPLVDFAPYAAGSALTGANDYFEVTIIYRDRYEICGVYEGCFNNGKDVIRAEFRFGL